MFIIYYLLIFTWGLLETIAGFFVFLFAILFKNGRVYKNGYGIITAFGGNWGGLSLGLFQFCGHYDNIDNMYYFEHVKNHEFGHSLQVCLLGPLWIFIVGIPSMIHYNKFMNGTSRYKDYDDIWFEGQATSWGTSVMNKLEENIDNED